MDAITLYPLSNYVLAVKEPQYEQDATVTSRLQRLEDEFEQYGMRRTVEGVLLAHEHGTPFRSISALSPQSGSCSEFTACVSDMTTYGFTIFSFHTRSSPYLITSSRQRLFQTVSNEDDPISVPSSSSEPQTVITFTADAIRSTFAIPSPGDYLKPPLEDLGISDLEADELGLISQLEHRLGQGSIQSEKDTKSSLNLSDAQQKFASSDLKRGDDGRIWNVKGLLAKWWRPNFETFMFPYIPPHISQPKEVKSIFVVQLPKYKIFQVPGNMKLIALPLFELYDNAVRYGPLLAALPHLLSKYDFKIEGGRK